MNNFVIFNFSCENHQIWREKTPCQSLDLCCMTVTRQRQRQKSTISIKYVVTVNVCGNLCKKESHSKTCSETNLIANNHRQLCHRWWWLWWWWPLRDAIDYRAIILWHEFHLALIANFIHSIQSVSVSIAVRFMYDVSVNKKKIEFETEETKYTISSVNTVAVFFWLFLSISNVKMM